MLRMVLRLVRATQLDFSPKWLHRLNQELYLINKLLEFWLVELPALTGRCTTPVVKRKLMVLKCETQVVKRKVLKCEAQVLKCEKKTNGLF